MEIARQPFIVIDVQTTGTQADIDSPIEASWAIYRGFEDPSSVLWQTHLIALEDGATLPRHIQKMTGIAQSEMDAATYSRRDLAAAWEELLRMHADLPVLLHYARFKLPFIEAALGASAAAFHLHERCVCTFQVAKRLLPHLKSHTLRALAGHAGYSMSQHKRALDHGTAIAYLWHGWAQRGALGGEYTGPSSLNALRPIVESAPKADELRAKRLALSEDPGVYFFKDQSGRILYVGKATRLKHRVNSYFRGRKSKGSHLNEMLVRVSDIEVQECISELHALLVESDAIKQFNPPYNRLLKADDRTLHWLPLPSRKTALPGGPLAAGWLTRLAISLTQGKPKPSESELRFLLERPEQLETLLREAYCILDRRYELKGEIASSCWWRELGSFLWETQSRMRREENHGGECAQLLDADEGVAEQEEITARPEEKKKIETAEELADAMTKGLMLLCSQLYRGRWLERLVAAELSWTIRGEGRGKSRTRDITQRITVQAGQIVLDLSPEQAAYPEDFRRSRRDRRLAIDLAAYDRLSILYRSIRHGLRRGDSIRLALRPGLVLDERQLKDLIL